MLVLASASPRRHDLLRRSGVRFEAIPADVAELARPGEPARELVERLALLKASHVAGTLPSHPARVVLGSDTAVVLEGEILGKPRDPAHAVEMLARLVGRVHRVMTGVALVETGSGAERVISVESEVRMRQAGRDEIRAYVAGGEPLDKAGAYALQGEGRRFVERVEGSETNVIGLPLEETLALLHAAGVEPEA